MRAAVFDAETAHRAACEAGQPLYFDPRLGLWVMTADALKARGACCGNGCRHCPYVGTALEHPKRSSTRPSSD